MLSKLVLLTSCMLLILCSCKSDSKADAPNPAAAKLVADLNLSDTFRYDFVVNDEGKFDSVIYNYIRRDEGYLEISRMDKGYDSLQIRIHYGCALGGERLVILSHQGGRWTAEIVETKMYFREGGRAPDSVAKKILSREPKSGWVNLIDKLFELKILSLEDNQQIHGFGYAHPTDGCGVGIEIATKKIYRFYNYDNPDHYSEAYWQARNILSILELINKEFKLNEGYWPESDFFHDKIQLADIAKKVKMQEVTLEEVKSQKKKKDN
jgi:hypothetical protein